MLLGGPSPGSRVIRALLWVIAPAQGTRTVSGILKRPRSFSRYNAEMGIYLALWKSDYQANRGSAKGRLVVSLFRFGQALPAPVRRIYHPAYYVLVDVLIGVSLPLQTDIGGGFVLRHGQGVVVSWRSRIGARCELHQHVTLGEKGEQAPVLGDDVVVGANAVLLGGITIGAGATIGAGSVVLIDVPPGAVAVGNPARIVASITTRTA